MYASDYRARGRAALRGNWAVSILVSLVAGLLGAGSSSSYSVAVSSSGASAGGNAYVNNGVGVDFGAFHFLWPIAVGFFSFMAVYAIITFVFGGAVNLGLRMYNIDLVQNGQANFGTLFSRFAIFGRALLLQLAMGLFIFLWTLLLVIPGIVASYRYAMAPYLMAQNPDLGVMEAISLSKQMMYGHKARLFFLQLSFIGWFFLCVLTAGVGFLWLNPYISASEAAFYTDVARLAPEEQPVAGEATVQP